MILNYIKNARQLMFQWVIQIIQPESKNYYGSFKGTTNPRLLLVKNIIRPLRIFNRYRYRQSFWGGSRRSYNSILQQDNDESYFLTEDDFELKLREFKNTGVCELESYFPKEICNQVLESIDEEFSGKSETDEYFIPKQTLPLTADLLKIWVNPTLIKLLSKYMSRSVYARGYPNLNQINPPFTNPPTKEIQTPKALKLNIGWHFDTVNLLLIVVLLKDINKDDSVMQVLSGSHLNQHVNLTSDDYYLSDEHIASKSYNIKNLDGKAGSVYLVDTNAYHRLYAVKGSIRKVVHFEFTPGHNLLLNINSIAEALRLNPKILDTLPVMQRNVLSGLFPNLYNFGYTLTASQTLKSSKLRC